MHYGPHTTVSCSYPSCKPFEPSVKLLSLARDLQRRKARERQGCFVAEGVRTVEVLLASPLETRGLLVTADLTRESRGQQLVSTAEAAGITVREISDKDFASAASTDTPQGVLAVAVIPPRSLAAPSAAPSAAPLAAPLAAGGRYLLLDAIQDPGNVGTIIRTAAAFGVTATVALPGTVDFWNAKVVRSAMGALFVHQALAATWETVTDFLDTHAVECWAADTGGQLLNVRSTHAKETLPAQLALVVSNEGAGLSPHVRERATRMVAVGMVDDVESLNVAVATGILLHALRPD